MHFCHKFSNDLLIIKSLKISIWGVSGSSIRRDLGNATDSVFPVSVLIWSRNRIYNMRYNDAVSGIS